MRLALLLLLTSCRLWLIPALPTWDGDRHTVCDGVDAGLVLAGDAIFQCGAK